MADFRRSIPVLAVLALVLFGATTASAQVVPSSLACVATAAVPPIVRAEGITELVGDLLLRCNGGVPTAPGVAIPPVNVQIFMNTNVTSKLLVSATSLTEALLMLDEPGVNPANLTRTACTNAPLPCTNLGNGLGTPAYYGPGANSNIFQGELAPGRTDSILWRGVPIDPPGTSGERVIRITNVRVYAAALGTGIIPVPITELVTLTGTFSVPVTNPQPTVGVIQKTLQIGIDDAPTSLQQCFSVSCGSSAGNVGTLEFTELVPSAFKKFNVGSSAANPTGTAPQNNFLPSLNTETGYFSPDLPTTNGLNVAGLPTAGTRLRAVFNNVPSGVTLTVPLSLTASGLGVNPGTPPVITDVAVLVTSETGGFAAASSGVVALSTSGSGTAVWEVTEANASTFVTFSGLIQVCYVANPGGNSPAIGPTATVNMSYAPVSTTFTSAASPVPRFVDTSTALPLFSVNACVTNLLFPFVTNQAGFDTGLAIASTSTDPFGTSPQGGICNLNWFGANEPSVNPTVTPTVPSRTTWVGLTSSIAPNFQGYMIAVCRFQYGHGFAFVSDFGARNLAMGYLALIIPDPARSAFPFPCGGNSTIVGCSPSGEQLGQ